MAPALRMTRSIKEKLPFFLLSIFLFLQEVMGRVRMRKLEGTDEDGRRIFGTLFLPSTGEVDVLSR